MNVLDRILKLWQQSRIARDSALVVCYKGVIGVVGVLTSICLARLMSMEAVGEYFLYLSYFALAELAGLSGANVIVSKSAMKNEDYVYRKFLVYASCSALGFGALLALLGVVLPLYVTGLPARSFFLLAVYTSFTGIHAYESYLAAKKLFKLSQQLILLRSIATFAVVAGAAYIWADAFIALCAYVAAHIACALIGTACSLQYCASHPSSECHEFSYWWQQGRRYIGLSIINVVSAQAARIILGNISPELLALYQMGVHIPTRIKDNVKVILSVTSVHWGALSLQENLRQFLANRHKIILIPLAASLFLIALAPFCIPLFYGDTYTQSVIVFQLCSAGIVFNMYGMLAANIDIYQREGKLYAQFNILSKGLFLALLLWLVHTFSYVGPAIASLIIDILSFLVFGYFVQKLGKSFHSQIQKDV